MLLWQREQFYNSVTTEVSDAWAGFSIRGVLPACLWPTRLTDTLIRRLLCCWLNGENNCCALLLKRVLFVSGTPRP